jgi:hypothetical protein
MYGHVPDILKDEEEFQKDIKKETKKMKDDLDFEFLKFKEMMKKESRKETCEGKGSNATSKNYLSLSE